MNLFLSQWTNFGHIIPPSLSLFYHDYAWLSLSRLFCPFLGIGSEWVELIYRRAPKGVEEMKTERIGSRGVLFTLEEHESAFASDYYMYLIEGENTVYLCDTHVGPRSMEPIGDYMRENAG